MTEPLLVGVREAARRLSIGRDTTYRLVAEGRIRSVRLGRRRLVPVAELAAFVAREMEGGGAMDNKGAGKDKAPDLDVAAVLMNGKGAAP